MSKSTFNQQVTISDELHEQIRMAAWANNRFFDAEVIERLEASFSAENQPVQAEQKQAAAQAIKDGADQREAVRVAGHLELGPSEAVKVDHLLRLTVPHFTDTKKGQAEPDQHPIFVARRHAGSTEPNAGNHKRNRPLAVLAKILGIHGFRAPFAEFRIVLHLDNHGALTQEVHIPPGWFVVDNQETA